MAQNYKVFIGGSVLWFGKDTENQAVFNTNLINPKMDEWSEIIADLETSEQQVLIDGNLSANWNNFTSNYKLVEAAGGLVKNQNGDWLFIYRNGIWDLPKGKLEKGESIEECAVREVAEECGIEEPTITRKLTTTYHTYTLKGERILKPTYWYVMKSADTSKLIPQTEEGITEVKWVATKDAIELAKNSFGSIKEVVSEELN